MVVQITISTIKNMFLYFHIFGGICMQRSWGPIILSVKRAYKSLIWLWKPGFPLTPKWTVLRP